MSRRYRRRRGGFFERQSVTNILIYVNVVVFVLSLIILSLNSGYLSFISLKPVDIVQGKNVWTLFTHMFTHIWFAHLFFNMFSLFFVGNLVEKIIGRKRFLWFYLISGILAGIFFSILSGFFGTTLLGARVFGDPSIPGVGASGALFGLVGLLAVLIPTSSVYLIAGPLIAIVAQAILNSFFGAGPVLGLINWIVIIYIFLSIFLMLSFSSRYKKLAVPIRMPFWILPFVAIVPLAVIGLFVSLPIANTAHFGGLIIGVVYGFYLRSKYSRKVKMLNRMFV